MSENQLIVINEDGTEIEMEILFTFNSEDFNKDYVLYVNPENEAGDVFVSSYSESGELFDIEDENEWAMIEEVFATFIDNNETSKSIS